MMLALPLLFAVASPAVCARPALTLATRSTFATLVGRAARRRIRPDDVGDVIEERRWRLVWATPADAERGVFFLRRDNVSRWRFVAVWGGVTAPDERAATIRWARQRGRDFPPALARCFADALLAEK